MKGKIVAKPFTKEDLQRAINIGKEFSSQLKAEGGFCMIGDKKAVVFAIYLISFSIFNSVFPNTLWVNYILFGLGFGILMAQVKNT